MSSEGRLFILYLSILNSLNTFYHLLKTKFNYHVLSLILQNGVLSGRLDMGVRSNGVLGLDEKRDYGSIYILIEFQIIYMKNIIGYSEEAAPKSLSALYSKLVTLIILWRFIQIKRFLSKIKSTGKRGVTPQNGYISAISWQLNVLFSYFGTPPFAIFITRLQEVSQHFLVWCSHLQRFLVCVQYSILQNDHCGKQTYRRRTSYLIGPVPKRLKWSGTIIV